VVRAVTGEVCDEEALSRWVDPVRGVMKPSEFVPYLEDAKVLYKLDLFVIETALAEIRERKAAGLFIVPISVNLSWSDFTRCDMVTEISERMDRYGVPRHMLNVEITESVVGRHPEYMRLQVERFHKAGINVWMDDFGSGYSSLEFLQSFDFDLIKFDTEFIRDLYTGKKSRIIMTQLIQMALKIGIDTIAEGVETPEQESFLREIGVDKIQGFYYSNPVPLTEILRRYANDEGIGFENVDAAHYYSAISKTNLSDPGVTNDVNSSDSYYNAVPMGIIELDGDTAYAVRFNQSFQNVMSRLKDMPIDLNGKKNMRVEIELDEVFKEAAVRCVETGEWEYIRDCVLRGLTINAFLRKIAVNPVTGAAAVLVIMISVL
jgi:EAL domain-containing protein (putative c-di-GMP-specific phosphodiesterase class I)